MEIFYYFFTRSFCINDGFWTNGTKKVNYSEIPTD